MFETDDDLIISSGIITNYHAPALVNVISRRGKMDIFEVLSAISKRKKAFMHSGINEHEALMKAELDYSVIKRI